MMIPGSCGSNPGDVPLVDENKLITCTKASPNYSCSVNPHQVCIMIRPSEYDRTNLLPRPNYFDMSRGQPAALASMDSGVWQTMCDRLIAEQGRGYPSVALFYAVPIIYLLIYISWVLVGFANSFHKKREWATVWIIIWIVVMMVLFIIWILCLWVTSRIVGSIILFIHEKIVKNIHDGYKQVVLDMGDEFEGQGYVVEFEMQERSPILRFTPLEQTRLGDNLLV
jgi:hypothetical protein